MVSVDIEPTYHEFPGLCCTCATYMHVAINIYFYTQFRMHRGLDPVCVWQACRQVGWWDLILGQELPFPHMVAVSPRPVWGPTLAPGWAATHQIP